MMLPLVGHCDSDGHIVALAGCQRFNYAAKYTCQFPYTVPITQSCIYVCSHTIDMKTLQFKPPRASQRPRLHETNMQLMHDRNTIKQPKQF
jgi:hypothetical protein